ncbi:MAG: apolipoprotein N-acyltransferase [Elusimicrobia bacterium CG_4_9_14_3_um_filter_62_55]|nr:MAG: apolipoprotein N-acyltransferase [Elusimicrobia bacterium CG22_combo_CG10-13_8_21_14_all_63_91]PJA12779.1 MAG: apolipoprotein N-acyltransferase [Elusimicrobia bacterium CG_4_10_14_0_2_um_filter_63_34]PJB22995.1 MAG: apolipoprotein N-acyltransferase [Elusimicrobia bacterium CG_4_9_14_3_um_filter_62_55]
MPLRFRQEVQEVPRNRVAGIKRLACFAAGIAFSLCLPKIGFSYLAWFAPAALFYCARDASSRREAALLGFLFGFGFAGRSLFWIFHTCRFAGVPLPVSGIALTALAGFLALNWALYGAAVRESARRLPAGALPWVWALLWVALASASARWTPRVGFDLLAYTQYRWLPLLQLGAVFGPHGLAFLILVWNGALAELARKSPSRTPRNNLSAAGLMILAAAAWGTSVLAARPVPAPSPDAAAVEILQPNIDQYRKWDGRFEGDIRASIDALLARPRSAKTALVLWPESALPGWLDEPGNFSWIEGWAKRIGAPMIVGTITRSGERLHNSAVWIGADGVPAGLYHKRELVPFGEFVPMRRWLEPWIGILAQMGEFTAGGARQALFDLPIGKTAVTICYEAVFPKYGRLDAARGARVFVNLTNDGWYKNTDGPYQHLTTNILRAVENRATVIRAANTGISAVIDPWGVVLESVPIGERARLDARIPVSPFTEGSFYSRHGDWFGVAAILASLLLAAAALGERMKRARR